MQNRIFSFDDNAKAAKAAAFGYLNAIHYLAPHTVGGARRAIDRALLEELERRIALEEAEREAREARERLARVFGRSTE